FVISHRDGVRIERVGLDDVRARCEVLPMQVLNDLRLRKVEQVVVAFKLDGVICELAAKSGFIQLVGLDHRAHRTVKNSDPVTKKFFEFGSYVVKSCHASYEIVSVGRN